MQKQYKSLPCIPGSVVEPRDSCHRKGQLGPLALFQAQLRPLSYTFLLLSGNSAFRFTRSQIELWRGRRN